MKKRTWTLTGGLLAAVLLAVPAIAQSTEKANAGNKQDASVVRALKSPPPGAEKAPATEKTDASVVKAKPSPSPKANDADALEAPRFIDGDAPAAAAEAQAHGVYTVTCEGDCGGTGGWTDTINNTVTTVGKNLALDTYLAGSSYTVTGPYMLLISSASYSAISAADTMSSHSGWLEAGNANAPTYSGNRKTAAWSSASSGSKSLSAGLAFSITGTGTVKGCALVFGSGASATVDNTSGTLYSAGLFTGGDKALSNGDTLTVTYTASL